MSRGNGDTGSEQSPSMFANLTGQKFGELTVTQRLGIDDKGIQIWMCHCTCGNKAIVSQPRLLSHKIKHCSSAVHNQHLIDLTGQHFGRLTVLRQVPRASKNGNARWLCRCNCGNYVEADSYNLRHGVTRSCGCLRRENSKKLTQCNDGFKQHMGDPQALKNDDGVYISSVRVSKRNHTGVIGVSYDKSSSRWVARLRFRGRYVLNKACESFGEAVTLRHQAERKYLGESN